MAYLKLAKADKTLDLTKWCKRSTARDFRFDKKTARELIDRNNSSDEESEEEEEEEEGDDDNKDVEEGDGGDNGEDAAEPTSEDDCAQAEGEEQDMEQGDNENARPVCRAWPWPGAQSKPLA